MLNYIWLGLVVAAVLIGGFHNLTGAPTGTLKEMTDKGFEMAKTSVEIAIGLVGIMALWLGIMRLAEKAGLVQLLARTIRPVMKWLFPDVPPEHPAMGSMLMNMAANFLGLSNAATPLGLRAMKDLETLNPRPGTATNAMCTFLAINTSSIQLVPATAVAILAAQKALQPYAIIGSSIIATAFSTLVAIAVIKLLERWPGYRLPSITEEDRKAVAGRVQEDEREKAVTPKDESQPLSALAMGGLAVFFLFFVALFVVISFPQPFGLPISEEVSRQHPAVRCMNTLSLLAVPFLVSFFPLYAALRRVKVYEQFVEGAKEGFEVAVKIIPYLVAILVAVGLFRGAGGIELITGLTKPVLDVLQFPSELLPMCLMRPLSGSGSLGVFTELVKEHGPDSMIARMAGTIYGSSETTFYVIAVYFGAVMVKRTRHAVPAGLIADAVGIVASIIICRMMFS